MRYFIRSVKYFFSLCVLCIALMALMLVTGTSALSFDDTIYAMLHTDRYLMLLSAIVILSAFYPKFGFIVRRLDGDMAKDRQQIINAFKAGGFVLRSEQEGVMTFRAGNLIQKLMFLGEDEILVSQEQGCIVLDGIRRGVARVQYRLKSYLEMNRRND